MMLVTGATGFLGQAVVRALKSGSTPVRVLARDPRRAASLAQLGADVHVGDLRDTDAVAAACRGVTHVVHCGALSSPWGNRRDFHAVNVEGTANVINGCVTHGVRRLVHISSPSVTFDGSDQVNATEDAAYPAQFASAYSWSKKLGEDRVRDAIRSGLDAVILRPKAIFGPGDTSLVPRLLTAAQRGRLRQIGDGTNRVDLTYVDNVVAAIQGALTSPAAAGRTYTITNDEHPELWTIIRQLLSATGHPGRLGRVSTATALAAARVMEWRARIVGDEPSLTRYAVLILARTQTYDISAARRDLGYQPVVSLEAGVAKTIQALGAAS